MAKESVVVDSENDRRLVWPGRIYFILSCIGGTVGFGNFLRFPSLAYIYGGGTFLYPYIILLLTIGLPIYYFEIAVGQFCNRGPVLSFNSLSPACTGIGISMALISLIITFYYNTFLAFSLLYVHQSIFRLQIPWFECNSEWGADEYCVVSKDVNKSSLLPLCGPDDNKVDPVNCTDKSMQFSTEQYFHKAVLRVLSPESDWVSLIFWLLVFYLIITWILTYININLGLRNAKRLVRFTLIIPYLLLVSFLAGALAQEGAFDGLAHLFIPHWQSLLNVHVWISAACQLFFSLNISYGGVIMYSSFRNINDNILGDAVLLTAVDFGTSLLSSCVVFSTIGFLSQLLGSPFNHLTKVATGPGLIYVVYPEAISRFPLVRFWNVIFFLALVLFGLNTQFTLLQTFFTSIYDSYNLIAYRYRFQMSLIICSISFFINVSCLTKLGPWIISAFDHGSANRSILFIALCEICSLTWYYGVKNFFQDLTFMTGVKSNKFFNYFLVFIMTLILAGLLLGSIVVPIPISFYDLPTPMWADFIMWTVTVIVVIQIPGWLLAAMIYFKLKGKSFLNAFSKNSNWCPKNPNEHDAYFQFIHKSEFSSDRLDSSAVTMIDVPEEEKNKKTSLEDYFREVNTMLENNLLKETVPSRSEIKISNKSSKSDLNDIILPRASQSMPYTISYESIITPES